MAGVQVCFFGCCLKPSFASGYFLIAHGLACSSGACTILFKSFKIKSWSICKFIDLSILKNCIRKIISNLSL